MHPHSEGAGGGYPFVDLIHKTIKLTYHLLAADCALPPAILPSLGYHSHITCSYQF